MSMLTLALTHPMEFRTLVQFWMYHEQQQEHAISGWDRQSMRRCLELLDLTSRSFSAVLKELDGDLARIVSTCWNTSKVSGVYRQNPLVLRLVANECSFLHANDPLRYACSTSYCEVWTQLKTT